MNLNFLRQVACEFLELETITDLNNLYVINWKLALDDWNKYGYQEYDKNTLANIIGLVGFSDNNRTERLLYPLKELTGAKVLDFGGGIGTNSIELASQGNDVYYYDLPSKTQEFAKYLSARSNVKINFITEEEMNSMKFDVILATDVLEHIKEPMLIVKNLHSLLKLGGLFLTTGLNFSISSDSPMHLKENLDYRKEYDRYMESNFVIKFYQISIKETIFLWRVIHNGR